MDHVCRLTKAAAALVVVAASIGSACGAFPTIRLETVTSGELFAPVALTNAGDGSGRLFAVDQRGKIQIVQNGSVLPTPFLDLGSKLVPARAGFDERGLLGLAFHPDYGTVGEAGSGKFYVFYSTPSPNAPGTTENPVNAASVIAEYRVSPADPNVADPGSERILLSFDKPQFNHNGGNLAFGPDDMLYISTGDGGSRNDNNYGHTGGSAEMANRIDPVTGRRDPVTGNLGNAQDKTNLLGKILRIDPTPSAMAPYTIPSGNPFVGAGGGVREEIYAYGLRNPWRFSFDDGPGGTNRLFVADVGQDKFEEIDIIHSGGNYGWRAREGLHAFDPTTPNPDAAALLDPIIEYSHPGVGEGVEIGLSVTGGFVYRGSESPQLAGKYIFADWSNGFGAPQGTLLGLEETLQGPWELSRLSVEGFPDGQMGRIDKYITALGRDEAGELYLVARSALQADPPGPTGTIYRITVVPEPAMAVLLMTGLVALLVCAWRIRRRI